MLLLRDFRWGNLKFQNVYGLRSVLSARLQKLNIAFKLNENGEEIYFPDSTIGKGIKSASPNKIKMNEDDPRIKKLGRDYLETYRLTKQQYESFFETIQGVLDELNLEAKIEIVKGDERTLLRDGLVKFDFPKYKKYPTKG